MSLYSRRLLDHISINDGDTMNLAEALDLGDYRTLGFSLTVHEAGKGTDPVIVLQHAATNAEDQYGDLSAPVRAALDVTGTSLYHAESFLRWVRWTTSGTLSSGAVVSLDLIAKT